MIGVCGLRPLSLSLRVWLLCLSLLATAPLLVFSLSLVWELRKAQEAALLDQLERRSDELTHAVARTLEGVIGALTGVAESRAGQELDSAELVEHAQRLLQRVPEIRAVTLVDAQEVLFLVSRTHTAKHLSLNVPEYAQAALDTQTTTVSGPFDSPVSPVKVVAISVPILQGGRATHALRAILTVDSINQLIAADRLPRGWIAGVADRTGILVARSHEPLKYVGQMSSPSFVEGVNNQSEAAFVGATLEGTPTMNRVVPVFHRDWYLGMAVPLAILHQPVYAMLLHVAGLALLWIGLAITASLLFSAYLVRQMRQVAVAMGRSGVVEGFVDGGAPIRVSELADMLFAHRATQASEVRAREDQREAESQRDEVEDLYDHAPCGYHSLDRDGRIVRINQTELGWLERTREEVMLRPFADFLTPESQQKFAEHFPRFKEEGVLKDLELQLVQRGGAVMSALVNATAIYDADGHYVASRTTVLDHTEKKRFEAELHQLAHTDYLTGLRNRRDFYERSQQEIAPSTRYGLVFTVLLLDIDHFKKINDQHGHAVGDSVLRHLAKILQAEIREIDIAARLGGEEFAVLMPKTPGDGAVVVAERVRQRLEQAVVEGGSELQHPPIRFTASIGLATWHADETEISDTLSRADSALYLAKREGRNRVCRDR